MTLQPKNMTVNEALALFETTRYGLAKLLHIEPMAVYLWKKKIPELRAYQLLEIHKTLTNEKNPE